MCNVPHLISLNFSGSGRRRIDEQGKIITEPDESNDEELEAIDDEAETVAAPLVDYAKSLLQLGPNANAPPTPKTDASEANNAAAESGSAADGDSGETTSRSEDAPKEKNKADDCDPNHNAASVFYLYDILYLCLYLVHRRYFRFFSPPIEFLFATRL